MWIETYTGKRINLLAPTPESICIEDIAHSLAHQCRFTGHCKRFYSVCEHSLYVMALAPPELDLEGLLHDAHEAYCSDLASPMKRVIGGYRAFEDRMRAVVALRFGLADKMPDVIKRIDTEMLLREQLEFFGRMGENGPAYLDWGFEGVEPADVEFFVPNDPALMKSAFLTMYYQVLKEAP